MSWKLSALDDLIIPSAAGIIGEDMKTQKNTVVYANMRN